MAYSPAIKGFFVTAIHHQYMSLALKLAEQGRLSVSPNPMVGCVIVKDNHIVGEGFHQQAGGPHAEIFALQMAGKQAEGATVYVTLEPCCHFGKTPPCTDALIKAKIKKIYIACLDPNPLVSGKGMELLQQSGIETEIGLAEADATQLNNLFFHYIKHKRPFVMAKWAMSLDGKTIVAEQDAKQISGLASHAHSHQLREMVDAILIGANTARLDNPQLTARNQNEHLAKQPIRIILAGNQPLPTHLKIFSANLPGKTILVVPENSTHSSFPSSIEILNIPSSENGKISLSHLLTTLGEKEITSLLVEGGMSVLENFFQENLIDQFHVYLAPVIIGSLTTKQPVNVINFSRLGKDFYFNATTEEPFHV